jgi:hypothetical protein
MVKQHFRYKACLAAETVRAGSAGAGGPDVEWRLFQDVAAELGEDL